MIPSLFLSIMLILTLLLWHWKSLIGKTISFFFFLKIDFVVMKKRVILKVLWKIVILNGWQNKIKDSSHWYFQKCSHCWELEGEGHVELEQWDAYPLEHPHEKTLYVGVKGLWKAVILSAGQPPPLILISLAMPRPQTVPNLSLASISITKYHSIIKKKKKR